LFRGLWFVAGSKQTVEWLPACQNVTGHAHQGPVAEDFYPKGK